MYNTFRIPVLGQMLDKQTKDKKKHGTQDIRWVGKHRTDKYRTTKYRTEKKHDTIEQTLGRQTKDKQTQDKQTQDRKKYGTIGQTLCR